MELLKTSYRGMDKDEAIEELIREKAAKLEKFHPQTVSCRVAIEKRHQHQDFGRPYRVRIEARIPPGHDVVAERRSTRGDMHEPLQHVVREAFDAAYRQVKEIVERQRRDVKEHPEQETMALVEKLFPQEGYGFLRTLDGREVFFHRNSVLGGDFDRLKVGTGVRFAEEEGEKGPQASTVQIVDKQPQL
ncbi:MAG: HPF/RaiA family ribosome-associated protein [Chloroflexota bacterium]